MARVAGGGADIARIGAVVFEDAAAGLREELAELAEVIFGPETAEAGGIAEARAAGFSGLGVDGVGFGVDRSAGQE
jgi:hypothetical protein